MSKSATTPKERCAAELPSGVRCGMVANHDGTHYALIDGKTTRWLKAKS